MGIPTATKDRKLRVRIMYLTKKAGPIGDPASSSVIFFLSTFSSI